MSNLSRLGRLFMYAKGESTFALENFVTEALAQAIAVDAAPMITAIRRSSFPEALQFRDAVGSVAVARSQLQVPGGGAVDLAMELYEDGRRTDEWWIESKIDAPLSLGQLEGYARAAASIGRTPTPQILLLARRHENPNFPWLSWLELVRAVHETPSSTSEWNDLVSFLKERDVADEGMLPIEDLEAGTLEPAQRLFQKVRVVLTATHERLFEDYPDYRGQLTWLGGRGASNVSAMLNSMGAYFVARRGLLAIGGPISYGLVGEGGSSYWSVACQVPSGHTAGTLLTKASSLGPEWNRSTTRTEVLEKRVRLGDIRGRQDPAEWLIAAIGELSVAGLLPEFFPSDTRVLEQTGSELGDDAGAIA